MTGEFQLNKAVVTGALLAAVVSAGGWAWTANERQRDKAAEIANARVDRIEDKQTLGLQRLSKNEAEIAALREGFTRIDTKLDALITALAARQSRSDR